MRKELDLKQVVAGDQLVLKSELVMQKRGIYKYNCTASVDGIVAATAEIMISHQKQSRHEQSRFNPFYRHY